MSSLAIQAPTGNTLPDLSRHHTSYIMQFWIAGWYKREARIRGHLAQMLYICVYNPMEMEEELENGILFAIKPRIYEDPPMHKQAASFALEAFQYRRLSFYHQREARILRQQARKRPA